jgi:MoxR-like ATPase
MATRHYVVPDDVVAVAESALAHRVLVADGMGSVDAGREVVRECLAQVPPPTA